MGMWLEKSCGDLENIIDQLNELVPMQGKIKGRANQKIEKFRKAQNVVHDIFNNGLMNRGREVGVLGVRKRDLPLYVSNSDKWDIIENRIAPAFREIVMNAVLEQFGREVYLQVSHNRSSDLINKFIKSQKVDA